MDLVDLTELTQRRVLYEMVWDAEFARGVYPVTTPADFGRRAGLAVLLEEHDRTPRADDASTRVGEVLSRLVDAAVVYGDYRQQVDVWRAQGRPGRIPPRPPAGDESRWFMVTGMQDGSTWDVVAPMDDLIDVDLAGARCGAAVARRALDCCSWWAWASAARAVVLRLASRSGQRAHARPHRASPDRTRFAGGDRRARRRRVARPGHLAQPLVAGCGARHLRPGPGCARGPRVPGRIPHVERPGTLQGAAATRMRHHRGRDHRRRRPAPPGRPSRRRQRGPHL